MEGWKPGEGRGKEYKHHVTLFLFLTAKYGPVSCMVNTGSTLGLHPKLTTGILDSWINFSTAYLVERIQTQSPERGRLDKGRRVLKLPVRVWRDDTMNKASIKTWVRIPITHAKLNMVVHIYNPCSHQEVDTGEDLEARSSTSPVYMVVSNKVSLTRTWKAKIGSGTGLLTCTCIHTTHIHTHHRHTDKEEQI